MGPSTVPTMLSGEAKRPSFWGDGPHSLARTMPGASGDPGRAPSCVKPGDHGARLRWAPWPAAHLSGGASQRVAREPWREVPPAVRCLPSLPPVKCCTRARHRQDPQRRLGLRKSPRSPAQAAGRVVLSVSSRAVSAAAGRPAHLPLRGARVTRTTRGVRSAPLSGARPVAPPAQGRACPKRPTSVSGPTYPSRTFFPFCHQEGASWRLWLMQDSGSDRGDL